MLRYVIVFLLGVLLGSLLLAPTTAQNAMIIFGTVSGAAKPIAVDSSGRISIVVN